jgi:predicted ATPase
MRRFILTGAPGSGKTAILRHLEMEGFGVVEEAATDLIALRQSQGIAEPWTEPRFVEDISDLQMRRLGRASSEPGAVQFHDRSVVCTLALARYLDLPEPASLMEAVERIVRDRTFEKIIFLVRPWDSLHRQRRGGSATTSRCASDRCTRRRIVPLASIWFASNPAR